MPPKRDRKYFINLFFEKHNEKYDYSQFVFTKTTDKIKIICPIHGIIYQNIYNHLNYGCTKCGYEKRNSKNRYTTEKFIAKATQIHGKKYVYSISIYKSNDINVKIFCNSCQTIFEQKPRDHLANRGCPLCAIEKSRLDIETYKTEGMRCGSILLATKVDSINKKYKWKCSNGHIYHTSLSSIRKAVNNSGTNSCIECFREFHLQNAGSTGFNLFGFNEFNFFKPYYENIFKNHNYTIQYPVESGRCGKPFFVDLVVHDLNLAIEYDEKSHKARKHKEYDIKRQEYISKKENLIFIRIDDAQFMKENSYFDELLKEYIKK